MTICWKVLFLVKWTLMSSTYPPIFEENSANIKNFKYQVQGSCEFQPANWCTGLLVEIHNIPETGRNHVFDAKITFSVVFRAG